MDESGSRDPSTGTADLPKDHLYVLLAVGMYERQWKRFESRISGTKLELTHYLAKEGKGKFELSDCEVKSNWVRNPSERKKKSSFLHELHPKDLERLVKTYFDQVAERRTTIMASVIDKRYLLDHLTHETMHKKAYEFLLERIQHYMREFHSKHNAIVVMDDSSKQLNRAVAMKHAFFQRSGNQNMTFPAIVEYPFFTASELSNGVQLADLLAYCVYRAFRHEDFEYPYFEKLLPNFYRRRGGDDLNGLKVWPETSPLSGAARQAWMSFKQKALQAEGK